MRMPSTAEMRNRATIQVPRHISPSGGLFAVEKKFAMSGVIALAACTGVGGIIIRDIALQQGPSAVFTDYRYLAAVALGALVSFFFASVVRFVEKPLLWLDAMAIGLFAVVGAQKTLDASFDALAAMLIGTINSVGGWGLRDVLSGETPQLALATKSPPRRPFMPLAIGN